MLKLKISILGSLLAVLLAGCASSYTPQPPPTFITGSNGAKYYPYGNTWDQEGEAYYYDGSTYYRRGITYFSDGNAYRE